MNPETSKQILSLLDGDLAPAERERLADLIERDPEVAREFDEAMRFESLLVAAHRGEPDARRIREAIRVRMLTRRLRILRGWMAAAASIVAIAAGALLITIVSGRGAATVEEGRISVAGAPVQRVREGELMRTGPDAGGVVRLTDGSRVALAPASAAVLRGRSGETRQVVELREGKSGFAVETGPRQFSVITKVGRVTVLGTKFDVQVLPDWRPKEEAPMNGKAVLAMAVAVTVGSVQVEVGGTSYTLSAGAQQVFAEESGGAVQPAQPKRGESERGGESAQPAKPGKSGEGEGRGSSSEKSVSGEIGEIIGNTVVLKQGGDKGARTVTITLDSATVVSVETDEMEPAQGEGGKSKQVRRAVAGAQGDLAVGKRVTITEVNGVVTKVLVKAAQAKRSGGEGDGKKDAVAPQPRRGGEGERSRESGGGGNGSEKKGGEGKER